MGAEILDQLESQLAVERQVDNRDIRVRCDHARQGLGRGLRLAAHDEVGLVLDQIRQELADEWMVVDDEDAASRIFQGKGGRVGSIHKFQGADRRQRTRVPPLAGVSIVNWAPIMAARWAMMRRPMPGPGRR